MVDKNMEDVREIMIEFQDRIDVLETRIKKYDEFYSSMFIFVSILVLVLLCLTVFVASYVFWG